MNLEPVLGDANRGRRVEGQTLSGRSTVVALANFVKLPHTVFALPFALLGVTYASLLAPITLRHVLLVVVAFTAARFAAMGFNRIVDRKLDALNQRTMEREIPTGRLSVPQASIAVLLASAVFVLAAASLNRLCLVLSPLALAWIFAYSYTKRFTSWSHVWLGLSLGIAPVGGFLAVTGAWSVPWWTLPVLAGAVMTWVAGFDIFYALRDERFDRDHRLHSAVLALGQTNAILFAKVLHGFTIILLILFGLGTDFGALYYVGVGLAAAILAWEHQLVRPGDLRRLDAAFFTMNGIMSIVVFVFALVDRLA